MGSLPLLKATLTFQILQGNVEEYTIAIFIDQHKTER